MSSQLTFRNDNTSGYTQGQLDALNAELQAMLSSLDSDDEIARITSAFCDEVAGR